ncbi:hypothetical protein [Bilophila wadsworthia]|uniref:hypothetical protein n=1 Tax=Bilophila wadsworthia TaxID=35833 RepID=UPI00266F09B8|nr:hypothetical protein [Bilophila wadsworthia]
MATRAGHAKGEAGPYPLRNSSQPLSIPDAAHQPRHLPDRHRPPAGCLSPARDERNAQAAAKRIGRKTVPCGVPG